MSQFAKLAVTATLAFFLATLSLTAQVPQIINFQGKISVGATPFAGTGQFKFALVNGAGTTSFWSNDGTSAAGGEPTSAVSLPVTAGIYSVGLGNSALPNMTTVPASVFAGDDVWVRVWFNDGTHGSQLLSPDQRITSVGYAMRAASLSPVLAATAPAVGNPGEFYFNTTSNQLYFSNGSSWVAVGSSPAVYRWAVWSTYEQANGWYFANDAATMGGVNPSNWSDAGATANQISSDKKIQAAFFNKKAAIAPNSTVWAEQYMAYSSTDARMAGVLFRIRNKTASAISWTLNVRATAYSGWGEVASVSLNGANSWNSGGTSLNSSTTNPVVLSIPANRVSTVICVAGSGVPQSTASSVTSRACALAFTNNSLTLPAGLEFVDDLDTAVGGYEQ